MIKERECGLWAVPPTLRTLSCYITNPRVLWESVQLITRFPLGPGQRCCFISEVRNNARWLLDKWKSEWDQSLWCAFLIVASLLSGAFSLNHLFCWHSRFDFMPGKNVFSPQPDWCCILHIQRRQVHLPWLSTQMWGQTARIPPASEVLRVGVASMARVQN